MRSLCLIAAILLSLPAVGVDALRAAIDPNDEYILISGGPSLKGWEQYRPPAEQHDKWWGNFVRAARLRIEQLQGSFGQNIQITWLVYRDGYARRAAEDEQPLLSYVESVRDKYGVRLIWIESGTDIIDYVNSGRDRGRTKVSGLEYFGHSNKYCFALDYSNEILGASKAFLHQRQLGEMNKRAFARDAYCKSWGCHTGEAFSQAFKKALGIPMLGAIGKTDYSETWKETLPFISTPGGRWAQ